jgi:hypothetical protein
VLKLNLSLNKSEQGVVLTHTNACAGLDGRTSLSNDDVSGNYVLTVSLLHAETLGFAVTSVLSRTNTFFMSKELKTNSKHIHFLRF